MGISFVYISLILPDVIKSPLLCLKDGHETKGDKIHQITKYMKLSYSLTKSYISSTYLS